MSNSKNKRIITNPEQFGEYLHISRVSSWTVLAVVLLLLFGTGLWAYVSRINTRLPTVAESEQGRLSFYVKAEDKAELSDAVLLIEGKEYSVSGAALSYEPIRADEGFSEWMLSEAELTRGQWVYVASLDGLDLADGVYSAALVIDSRAPISFVVN